MPKSSKADAEETESGPQASDAATASAVPAFRNAKLFSGRFTLSRTGNVRGAAVGAAIGGIAGGVIGHVSEQPGQCYYRDRYGRRYIDNCPSGY